MDKGKLKEKIKKHFNHLNSLGDINNPGLFDLNKEVAEEIAEKDFDIKNHLNCLFDDYLVIIRRLNKKKCG